MFARLNKSALLLVTVGCIWEQTSFAQIRPPLLQTLENLLCATDSSAAKQQLDRLFNISPPGQSWPDEWLGTQANQASLQAGTLDIALLALQQTAMRFPNLRETAEQVALQWDYCEVLDDQQFYNLSWQANRLHKTLAAEPASKWAGFRQWGFLSVDPVDRFVPILLDEVRIAPNAYHLLLHRIYRKQCFPHPETGLLAQEEAAANPAHRREALVAMPQAQPVPYPFVWQPICVGKPHKASTASVALEKPSLQLAVTEQPSVNKSASNVRQQPANDKRLLIPIKIVILEPDTKIKAKTKAKTKATKPSRQTQATESRAKTTTTKSSAKSQLTESNTKPQIASSTKPLQPKGQGAHGKAGTMPMQKKTQLRKKKRRSAPKRILATKKKPSIIWSQTKPPIVTNSPTITKQAPVVQGQTRAVPTDAVLPAIVEPQAGGRIPLYLEPAAKPKPQTKAKTQAHGTTGIIKAPQKPQNLRLAASLVNSVSLKEGIHTLSASATWSPQTNWFISGNVSLKESQLSYAWSAGYADYKAGGWSAQLNNWGPIQPGQGLALDKASLNLGHKFKSIPLAHYKLTASGNLSVPIQGRPSVSGSLQWNPHPNWYARTTASLPLQGGKLNWHYAFGYNNPSILGKWKLEYSNYGNNAFPGDNLKDGTLSVTRSW